MPRIPAFRIEAIADLYAQLRYAPVETRKRELSAIETLVAEIDPQQSYPVDFVTYRITGYRPDVATVGDPIPGAALLAELASFVLRLSSDLDLPADLEGRTAIPMAEVERRLNVSRKTLQRYRRQGLLCHYVVFGDGEKRLACFVDALERFTERFGDRVERAARFTRLAPDLEATILQDARALRASTGASRHHAARRLARRHGRAVETVRQLLRRHDEHADEPIFDERGPLGADDTRLVARAQRFGVPVTTLARRLGKTASTIHRAMNRHRADRLRSFDLTTVTLPTFELPDAEQVILSAMDGAWAASIDEPATQALRFIARVRDAPPVDADHVDALLAGAHFVRWRAREMIGRLPAWPSATDLDRIETDLRLASAIKRRLVRAGFPIALLAIERYMHRRLDEQPGDLIVRMLGFARDVLAEEVDLIDPSRQRFDRRSGQATDRALAAQSDGRATTRAAARHADQMIAVDDLFAVLNPWDVELRLRPDWRAVVEELDPPKSEFMKRRYGLDHHRPHTRAQLADAFELPPRALGTRERAAMRAMRERALTQRFEN